MIDANQRWDVAEAISWVSRLAEFKPLWIEEPTCPDDILGHAAIAKVLQQLFCDVCVGNIWLIESRPGILDLTQFLVNARVLLTALFFLLKGSIKFY